MIWLFIYIPLHVRSLQQRGKPYKIQKIGKTNVIFQESSLTQKLTSTTMCQET